MSGDDGKDLIWQEGADAAMRSAIRTIEQNYSYLLGSKAFEITQRIRENHKLLLDEMRAEWGA